MQSHMSQRVAPGALLAVVALAAFTVWITWRAKAIELGVRQRNVLVGKLAPEFALESLSGRQISLSDYNGKTVVLTFWASWCGPCHMELPTLAKFYQRTHEAGSDFEIVTISIDKTINDAQDAARSLKIPFPVLLDLDGRLADSYQVEAIPVLFVVDRKGRIRAANVGFQVGLDLVLAQELGIRNYSPVTGDVKR
jgi:cytochrome c biogenesis protein CcmG, thiol:disulfide interchange protein DsbE